MRPSRPGGALVTLLAAAALPRDCRARSSSSCSAGWCGGIEQRAEGTFPASPADLLVPLSWLAAATAAAVHAGRLFTGRPDPRAAVLTGRSATGVQVPLLWDLPHAVRAALTAVLATSPLRMGGELGNRATLDSDAAWINDTPSTQESHPPRSIPR